MKNFFKYMNKYKTYWVEFIVLFNNRKKKKAHFLIQLYNILSIKIELNISILASFYYH